MFCLFYLNSLQYLCLETKYNFKLSDLHLKVFVGLIPWSTRKHSIYSVQFSIKVVIEKTSWHWKRHKLGNGTCNWPWRLFFLSFKFQINEEENQLWASIRSKSRNFQSETRTRDNSESSLYEKIFWIFFISGMSYKVPKVNSFDPDPCFFVAAWSHSINLTFQLNLPFPFSFVKYHL